MFNEWDSDKKIMVILIVVAAVGLAVTYKSVLAQTAEGAIQKVEGTLHQFTGHSPDEGKVPSRGSGSLTGTNRPSSLCCEPAGDCSGRPMRIGVEGSRARGRVIYPCRDVRRYRP